MKIKNILNKLWNGLTELLFRKNNLNNDLEPITNFDLDKFIGTWYEIARYDHWFERGLTYVYTTYSYNNKLIFVKNIGTDTETDEYKTVVGKAKLAKEKNIGWLKVSFFWFFYNDYKIIYADEKFNNIIVTGKNKDYFWILSKSKYVDSDILVKLIDKATELGFSEDKMIF